MCISDACARRSSPAAMTCTWKRCAAADTGLPLRFRHGKTSHDDLAAHFIPGRPVGGLVASRVLARRKSGRLAGVLLGPAGPAVLAQLAPERRVALGTPPGNLAARVG